MSAGVPGGWARLGLRLALPAVRVRRFSKLVDEGEGRTYSKHLVDQRRIRAVGGHGGAGGCLFKRHAPHKLVGPGTPVGGHGGKGGDVIVKATGSHVSLAHVSGAVLADDGEPGRKRRINGTSGADAIVLVPRGVVVHELLVRSADEDDAKSVETNEPDGLRLRGNKRFARGRLLADLDKVGDTLLVAAGGQGGRGNNMGTPYSSTEGRPGECRYIELELKMIADVGLIGLPNAGKSTLLGAVTRATPKIAPYPFTTVAPYVGQVYFQDATSMTIADVPGLVEDAHLGAGLGHDFLRHLERTRMLLYIIDAARSSDPLSHFLALRREVALFSDAMAAKPFGIVANKCDVATPNTLPRVDELHRALLGKDAPQALDGNPPLFIRAASARFGDGVSGLLQEVRSVMHGTHAGLIQRQRELNQPSDDAVPEEASEAGA